MTTSAGDAATAYPPPGCPRCAAPIAAGDRFCPRCGFSLLAAPGAWPASAPPPPPPTGAWTAYGVGLSEWWPRVGAMLLDSLVLLAGVWVVSAVIVLAAGSGTGPSATQFVVDVAIGGAYFGLLNGLGKGQTLGNKAASIAVRDATRDEPIGAARGILRWFVRFALYLFLLLPGLLNDLWPLWDRQRQTIADKAAGSVMVRRR